MEEIKDTNEFRRMLIREYNKIRTNPKYYAKKIKSMESWFKGKILYIPNTKIGIQTSEGAAGYKDAVKYLEKVKPVNKLEYNVGLANIANDYLKEIQKEEDTEKIDDININKIIDKYGGYYGSFGRAMDFGSNNPEMAIINLVVCDGDESRSQRDSMFDEEVKLIAVATGEHEAYNNCSVIVTCTEFNLKPGVKDIFKDGEKVNDKNQGDNEDNELEENEPGVKSVKKASRIITEKGKKYKISKVTKEMEDGTIETESVKEEI